MSAFTSSTQFAGEVTERAELLNGAMQLTLDGENAGSEAVWTIELTLSWRLGRAGAVQIDEGDLTLDSTEDEVVATLDTGTAEVDADTGNVSVDAMFIVEAGAPLHARLEIGAEEWTGQLVDRGDAGYAS